MLGAVILSVANLSVLAPVKVVQHWPGSRLKTVRKRLLLPATLFKLFCASQQRNQNKGLCLIFFILFCNSQRLDSSYKTLQ
jgi:hypothetical protein